MWKCYVSNDLTDKYVSNSKKFISENKRIGVLPPGAITNINLIENLATKKLYKDLILNEDYILISKEIWDFFYLNYSGGPVILLIGDNSIDIYQSSVDTGLTYGTGNLINKPKQYNTLDPFAFPTSEFPVNNAYTTMNIESKLDINKFISSNNSNNNNLLSVKYDSNRYSKNWDLNEVNEDFNCSSILLFNLL